jgi:primase-polymerase (primpol)-like protein
MKPNLEKPRTVQGDLHNLPAALAPLIALPHWVLWKFKWRAGKHGDGKWTKVPYQPSGRFARTDDPSTWSSYADVIRVADRFDGIGIVVADVGAFDIDHCRDPATGEIHQWAREHVSKVGSYTEITVSGTGLRIIGTAAGENVQRKLNVTDGVTCEVYRRTNRYIAITGNPLPDAPSQLVNIDAHINRTVIELDVAKKKAKRKESPENREQAENELNDLIRSGCGDRFEGDRSRAVWFVVNEMLRRGHTPWHDRDHPLDGQRVCSPG